MATLSKIKKRWRAQVRKAGENRCATFSTRAAALSWASTIEREIEELKSTGFMQPKSLTLADLIDRYSREAFPLKPWGRSKTADLKLLRAALGHELASNLTHERMLDAFRKMHAGGAGGVTISARAGYLITVLATAKDVWRLNVPLDAARSARSALVKMGLIKKGKHRDRRMTDAELERIVAHVERKVTAIPFRAIVWFSVASAMRISETCRLQWDDLNEADKTIRIKDRKHPSAKLGNDQIVPLLNATGHDAFAIAKAQPRKGNRIFPANSRTVSDYFTEAVAQLGIVNLHLHDIRHEAISRLFEAGYRIEEVSLVSGHRDWSMLKRYTHLRAVDLHRNPGAENRA
jgi:integrase